MHFLQNSLVELITQTSTNLPPDVRAAMAATGLAEKPDTQASQALNIIFSNIDMAAEDAGAICQDTGMPTFYVHTPVGVNQIAIRKAIRAAVAEATRLGKLRPNSVDSLTGKNSGDNLGPETPVIHFEQWEQDEIEVKLILKGGGCENKNIQYSLPATLERLGRADRTLEGVRKCLLHAVWQAQGQGCAPGAIGVCIGSDRAHGYDVAKEQLFRTLDDVNPDPVLAELETRVMKEANELGVGAMGFGGNVSLIGCKIAAANRLPASFFVSVAYNCWAFRRLGVRLDAESGAITQWLYRDPSQAVERMTQSEGFPLTGREIVLTAPLTRGDRAFAEGGRRGAGSGRHVYRARRGACASDEESAAGGSKRGGAIPLRSGDDADGGQVDGQGRRPDDQHSGRAIPGRCDQALWRAGGNRQGRHGREDLGRAEGVWSGLSECDRGCGAVLCAHGAGCA